MQMSATIIGLENKAKALERSRVDQALEDCLQIIMESTLAGFETRRSPTGAGWKPNPEWWRLIKGQSSPLTGMITTTIAGGPLAGVYKLEKANTKRMMHSLIKSKSGFTGEVRYAAAAKERAALNQHGGKSQMTFLPISKASPFNTALVFDVNIIERPHLGVATYPRIGDKTDAAWCEYYFGRQVDIQLATDFQ